MKKRVIAVIATLGLSTALFAMGPCNHGEGFGGPKSMHKRPMFQVMKQLDLTQEQKKAIQEIRKSQRAERKARKEKMKENRMAMRHMMKPDLSKFMSSTAFDKVAFKVEMNRKFEQREERMEKKRAAILEKRAENMEKIFNILTPEQRNKWIQLSQSK